MFVGIDDGRRRFAYSIVAGKATHHNASFQVFPIDGNHCRVAWTTDVLPDDLREPFERMIDAGVAAMRQTVEPDYAAAR